MLLPRSHAWTPLQKQLIVGTAAVVLALCGIGVWHYERHARVTDSVFVGTWQGTVDWHGSDFYFQFGADHTFSIWDRAWFEKADKEPEFVTKGRWHAGGRFLYLRYTSQFRPDGNVLEFWHIDDISPQELRMRYWRDGETHVFHRVETVTTRASNQAMQLTASKPAVYAGGVFHRRRMLRSTHSGLAAADLVSR